MRIKRTSKHSASLALLLLFLAPAGAFAKSALRWQDYDQPGFQATKRGAYQAAEFTLTSALERLNATGTVDDLKIVGFLERLIMVCGAEGKFDVAEQYCKLAIQFCQKHSGNGERISMLQLALADTYFKQRKFSLAEVQYRNLLVVKTLPVSARIRVLTGFGELKTAEGQYPDAQAQFKQALSTALKDGVAMSAADHLRFGKCLYLDGKLAASQDQLQEALQIDERDLGTNQPALAASLNDLAVVFMKDNRTADAEHEMRRAVAIARTFRYADLPDWLDNLSEILNTESKTSESNDIAAEAGRLRGKSQKIGAKPGPPVH